MAKTREQLVLRLPADLKRRLALAKRRDKTSFNVLVARAIQAYLARPRRSPETAALSSPERKSR